MWAEPTGPLLPGWGAAPETRAWLHGLHTAALAHSCLRRSGSRPGSGAGHHVSCVTPDLTGSQTASWTELSLSVLPHPEPGGVRGLECTGPVATATCWPFTQRAG